uniref:Thioredoxin domain-containing protein n=1 Tax=Zea mays TaxID=4577 RepID=A0A804N5X4_MAIZE
MTRVLLPLLLLLALPGAYARPARQYLGQCPGLEYGLPPFAAALRATCPVSTEGYWPPYEFWQVVSGEELLRMLDGKEKHTAVLFYASWCPFSQRTRSVFDDLSSMFPRVKHLAVEESSIMKRKTRICWNAVPCPCTAFHNNSSQLTRVLASWFQRSRLPGQPLHCCYR